jgi:hypothetical protein
MANSIRHKRTSTPGASPSTGDIATGELAINLSDGYLFYKDHTNVVKRIKVPSGDLVLANDLAALEGLSSTGIAVRSATDTWVQRTITGTSNEITISNGNGVSGNPTISLPTTLTFTGKTVTGGTLTPDTLNMPAIQQGTGLTEFPLSGQLGSAAFASVDNIPSQIFSEEKNSSYQVLPSDSGKLIVATGNITLTMPIASSLKNGWCLFIKVRPTYTVTLAKNSADTLNGVDSSITLVANSSGIVVYQSTTNLEVFGNTALNTQVSNIKKETPSGTINGSNATFTLTSTPVANSLLLFYNGLLMEEGAGNDYTISGTTITMLQVPETGSRLKAQYISN